MILNGIKATAKLRAIAINGGITADFSFDLISSEKYVSGFDPFKGTCKSSGAFPIGATLFSENGFVAKGVDNVQERILGIHYGVNNISLSFKNGDKSREEIKTKQEFIVKAEDNLWSYNYDKTMYIKCGVLDMELYGAQLNFVLQLPYIEIPKCMNLSQSSCL